MSWMTTAAPGEHLIGLGHGGPRQRQRDERGRHERAHQQRDVRRPPARMRPSEAGSARSVRDEGNAREPANQAEAPPAMEMASRTASGAMSQVALPRSAPATNRLHPRPEPRRSLPAARER